MNITLSTVFFFYFMTLPRMTVPNTENTGTQNIHYDSDLLPLYFPKKVILNYPPFIESLTSYGSFDSGGFLTS